MCVNQINPFQISSVAPSSDEWLVEMMENANDASQPAAVRKAEMASMVTQLNTRKSLHPYQTFAFFIELCSPAGSSFGLDS